jgi:uncharacterized protein YnzC (UPF0291/DUF896 family)
MLRKDKLNHLQYDIRLKKDGFEHHIIISIIPSKESTGKRDIHFSLGIYQDHLTWLKLSMREKNGKREFSSSCQWEDGDVIRTLKNQALIVLEAILIEEGNDPLSEQVRKIGGHLILKKLFTEEDVVFRRLQLNGMSISSKDALENFKILEEKSQDLSPEKLKGLVVEAKWQLTHLFGNSALETPEHHTRRKDILFGPMPKYNP